VVVKPAFKREFIASMVEKNHFVAGRKLRRYQRDILSSGKLELVSPFTGEIMRAISSHCVRDGSIVYQFDSGAPLLVAAKGMRFGYPLWNAVFESGEILYLPDHRPGESATQADLGVAERVFSDARMPRVGDDRNSRKLIIGHRNFAHHLWNELGGLDAWLRDSSPVDLSSMVIYSLNEPLGPLAEMFPELREASIVGGMSLKEIDRQPGLATRIGSMVIPATVRERVTGALERKAAGGVAGMLETLRQRWPVIWISSRSSTSNRSCVNQDEFLIALGKRLLVEFENSALLFDGFSLPLDFDSGKYGPLTKTYKERVKQTREDLDKMIAKIEVAFGGASKGRLVNISGLTIAEAVTVGAKADYYVCHAGTLQHKVAWFHNCPGFVHSCQAGITGSARRWYGEQVEDGITPEVLPVDLVEDIAPAENTVLATRNYSYRIKDVQVVARLVTENAHAVLGKKR
jgi:hypothetical protein